MSSNKTIFNGLNFSHQKCVLRLTRVRFNSDSWFAQAIHFWEWNVLTFILQVLLPYKGKHHQPHMWLIYPMPMVNPMPILGLPATPPASDTPVSLHRGTPFCWLLESCSLVVPSLLFCQNSSRSSLGPPFFSHKALCHLIFSLRKISSLLSWLIYISMTSKADPAVLRSTKPPSVWGMSSFNTPNSAPLPGSPSPPPSFFHGRHCSGNLRQPQLFLLCWDVRFCWFFPLHLFLSHFTVITHFGPRPHHFPWWPGEAS